MKLSLEFVVAIVLFASLAAALIFVKRSPTRPKVLPPPRSKGTARTFQESNSAASLLLDVLALKEQDARWATVLKKLNPDDTPHVRTLLLELRDFNQNTPQNVLETIEVICIESRGESEKLTRSDLLERTKSRLLG